MREDGRETVTVAGPGARGDEGVLAAVLPADARTLWVDDERLAHELRRDGYEIASAGADVAVLTRAAALHHAPRTEVVVVLLDGARSASLDGGRLHDAGARLRAYAQTSAELQQTRRQLRRRGHSRVRALRWDHGLPLGAAAPEAGPLALHRPQRYPRRAVVVAGGQAEPTLLDLAVTLSWTGAGRAESAGARAAAPLVTPAGTVLLWTEAGLLRVGLARGRQQVEAPASVLALLAEQATSDIVTDRVPTLLARGRAGAAHWSLEQRMPGMPARPPVRGRLLDDCVDFLIALHQVPPVVPWRRPAVAAGTAPVSRLTERAADVRRLADAARDRVADLPRGFGHGDFWHRNLLVEHGRLSGVVDWDSAGGERLPFLDLMHLRTNQALRPGGHNWGRAVVDTLLPWVERGGDAHAERYAAALGLSLTQELLRALVVVYWLDWLDYQVAQYEVRSRERRWVRGNVDLVADALAGHR